jgi:transposase
MLSISSQAAIFVAVEHVDFRLGIDGLAQRCRSLLAQDPMSGGIFVFRNRKRTAIKILNYDGQGFWLCHKRWSSGRLTWWPKSVSPEVKIPAKELLVLLYNGNPEHAKLGRDWRPVT